MDIISTILWPIKWVISAVLWFFHWGLTSLGMSPDSGWTWTMAIIGLVVIVRAALIPLFVKQILNQRVQMELAPELKRIQEKYRGKKDQFSREAMMRETQNLYKKHGTTPVASCLPMLLQMPIFFALYQVLMAAAHREPFGLLDAKAMDSFADADIFGAVLRGNMMEAFNNGLPNNTAQIIVSAVMIVIMTGSVLFTQLQITSKNLSESAKTGQAYQMQRIMIFVLPIIFIVTGIAFPIGTMLYWLTTNLWNIGQQTMIIRNMPTPGSQAYRDWEKRQEKKAAKKGTPTGAAELSEGTEINATSVPKQNTQRQQPVSKNRAKKQGKKK